MSREEFVLQFSRDFETHCLAYGFFPVQSAVQAYPLLTAQGKLGTSETAFKAMLYSVVKYLKKTTGEEFAGLVFDSLEANSIKYDHKSRR